jgi:hypothetical protein
VGGPRGADDLRSLVNAVGDAAGAEGLAGATERAQITEATFSPEERADRACLAPSPLADDLARIVDLPGPAEATRAVTRAEIAERTVAVTNAWGGSVAFTCD